MKHVFPLIPLFPLLGVLLNGLLGIRYFSKRWVHSIAVAAVAASFVASVAGFLAVRAAGGAALITNLFTWIPADWLMLGDHQSGALFAIDFSLRFDPLTAVMTLVVTGVGLLIHIYSIGYMAEDSSYARYFTYLNLFTFAMLVLVMGGNLAVMFIGWEGVGLCSYLLIGFWFTKDSASNAGKKAFITNRVGDFGFLLGTGLLIATLGTVDFTAIERAIGAGMLPHGLATAAALLLFLGATGKSAQIPLYTWLPDAMEGPTPVSALIHAATMVTGGVYMVARMNVLFSFSGTALTVVAVVGALTAVYAASMGFVQTDIKRVLAYSTISQIGYMFVGLGVGAFAAGIFHLMTHAFFKSLLFLAAGSVIHALSGEQDMTRMGGLRRHIPWTYRVFLVGALAIAGVPGLSGFFSKDEILTSAFASGHYFVWALGLCGAGMTAFYMFRLIFLTFFGAERLTPGARHHLHESPKVMIVPLQVLALLAIAGGWVGLPKVLGGGNWFGRFLAPVTGHHEAAVAPAQELMLMALSVGVALAGIVLAYLVYLHWQGRPARWLAGKFAAGYRILQNKYYVDDLYNILVVGGTKLTGLFLGHFDRKVVDGAVNGAAWAGRQVSRASIAVDTHVVDGSVNGLGRLNQACGRGLRRLQTGTIYTYALGVVIGLVALVSLVWTFKE